MRFARAGIAAVLLVTCAAAAPGTGKQPLTIAAGTLGAALIDLGRQAGVSIGVNDPKLADLPVAGFRGTMTVAEALDRLLRGQAAAVVAIDAQTYRIEPIAARPPVTRAPPRPLLKSLPTPSTADDAEIIVTASKRDATLDNYAGSAIVLEGAALTRSAGDGTQALVSHIPVLSSTHLGPGRNKLFIRGVADSSFNGPTQATVGQYLGEVRLTYAAPDPDLELYDVESVEVLEGPQGTLYGAGSLGGIFRIVPAPVDLRDTSASFAAGGLVTEHGAPGGDISGRLNLPVIDGVLGVRAVGYASTEGGYIDDPGRGLKNVNRTRTVGGRVAIRAEPGNGWTIDLGGVVQNINSADGQYAQRGLPPLTRHNALSQPFDNDYLMGNIVVTRDWGTTKLVSASGIVDHDVDARYDFTRPEGQPRLFEQDNRILLISNETRLTHVNPDGSGWLLGTSLISNSEELTRNLGLLPDPPRIIGVRNSLLEGAVYAEGSVVVAPKLVLTVGGRVSYDRLTGRPLDRASARAFEPHRDEARFLPSASLAWHPLDNWLVFARVQEGYRPGGLSVAANAGRNNVERFKGDSIITGETGVRIGDTRRGDWNLAASLSYAHWHMIQADLVDQGGLPYTANIGSGRILGAELRGGWRPATSLRLEASLFLNDSKLEHPAPAFADARAADLPNIADLGATASAHWTMPLRGTVSLTFDTSATYVGRSRLGVGDGLDIAQGRTLDTSVGARLGMGRYGVTLDVTNLFDTVGNRFALGDPFGVRLREQITPLRPRTIRIGVDAGF